jgi:hypothetical protein
MFIPRTPDGTAEGASIGGGYRRSQEPSASANIGRRAGVLIVELNRVAPMQDFIRDWRGWTKAERVLVGVIVGFAIFGVPTLLAINGRLSLG